MQERKPPAAMPARTQSRDVRITFRATEQEAADLRREAAARDLELSRLIRRWLRMGQRMDDASFEGKAARA